MKRLPQLDGLRTIAVGLVIATHTDVLRAGYVGVDVFFVLSGYLITNILLNERDAGVWSLSQFYARRFRRLAPALGVMLVVVLAAAPAIVPGTGLHKLLYALVSGSYLSDFAVAMHPMSFGALGHTWSLAVEEQFYLLWPLVLYRLRGVGPMLITACVAMLVLLMLGPQSSMVYLPFARGGSLVIGCIFAMKVRGRTIRHGDMYGLAGLAGLGVLAATGANAMTHGAGATATAGALFSVLILIGLLHGQWLRRVLAFKPLVWVGARSYGVYLWQLPIGSYLDASGWRSFALVAAVSLLFASISYQLVERRFAARKEPQADPQLALEPAT